MGGLFQARTSGQFDPLSKRQVDQLRALFQKCHLDVDMERQASQQCVRARGCAGVAGVKDRREHGGSGLAEQLTFRPGGTWGLGLLVSLV